MPYDGKYEIYIVQSRNEKDEWENVEIDQYCSDETGTKGTFDLDKARRVFCELIKGRDLKGPRNHRVCKIDIWQDTSLIW
jgi:hypothetical protein